ncbi:MarR family transcriptional regulator [Streptomyces sp. RS10V-4]|uniref:GbsR/MarR family transcriptional regulator n=1 Tax=Streptomyces rhizoryzae TaxID=2932493 RepID=UPI002006AE18|nr:MarR family transcriptional regulator [Streptomyces rhizoryzae]MCK7622854.1 MarR family transcriptional regulator [Streptomyces rhizoryzae]
MSDDEQLRAVAERLALILAQGGMQKTTARVMTSLLFSQRGTMTAADLCEELQISSGAVSGAVKQLTASGLLERVPAPGSRRDHYRFPDGAWARLMTQQNQMLATMGEVAGQGLVAAGDPATPAGQRLTEMADFYAFMLRELPPLVDRWRADFAAKGEGAGEGEGAGR